MIHANSTRVIKVIHILHKITENKIYWHSEKSTSVTEFFNPHVNIANMLTFQIIKKKVTVLQLYLMRHYSTEVT